MPSLEEAISAKAALRALLGRPAWLRGIGVGAADGEYCVQVNVADITPEVRRAIPESVDGVPVRIEAVGDIIASDDR